MPRVWSLPGLRAGSVPTAAAADARYATELAACVAPSCAGR
jgi:hypothetical protein